MFTGLIPLFHPFEGWDFYHYVKALALVYFAACITVQAAMALYHRAT